MILDMHFYLGDCWETLSARTEPRMSCSLRGAG